MQSQSTASRQQFVAVCQCGHCTQPTLLAPRTDPRSGAIKGQPLHFILGHNRRVAVNSRTRRKIAPRFQAVAVCRCGCGQPTLLADRTDAAIGYVEGQPLDYLKHHHPKGEDAHRYQGNVPYLTDAGYLRVQSNGKQRLQHVVMWEAAYGPIPKGYEVHHKNLCRSDNRLDNFQLLTKADHARLHARLRRELARATGDTRVIHAA